MNPHGLAIRYSPINQAWFLLWHGTVLGVFERKQYAIDEMDYLLRAHKA